MLILLILCRKIPDVTYCVHDCDGFETSFAVAGFHGQNLNVIFKPVFFDFLRDDARNVRAVPDKSAVISSVILNFIVSSYTYLYRKNTMSCFKRQCDMIFMY